MAGTSTDRDNDTADTMSQDHIPLGDQDIPLLAGPHAPLHYAQHRPMHIPQHGDAGYDDYVSKREAALELGAKALHQQLKLYTGSLK